jgi:hypothetical protein
MSLKMIAFEFPTGKHSANNVRVLLAAHSFMYDNELTKKGYNPSRLRELCVDDKGLTSLTDKGNYWVNASKVEVGYDDVKNKVSINLFRICDLWRDCNKNDLDNSAKYQYTGFRVNDDGKEYKIYKVTFTQEVYPDWNTIEDPEFSPEQLMKPINIFHEFGIGPFLKISNLVDWNRIIESIQ